jgi:hypothetical protein
MVDSNEFCFHLGILLIFDGINYVPLLVYAIVTNRSGSAQRIVEQDLAPNNHYIRKYSLQ